MKKKHYILISSTIIVCAVLFFIIMIKLASLAVIKDTQAQFHAVKIIFFAGKKVFCLQDPREFKSKDRAMQAIQDIAIPRLFSILSTDTIAEIYLLSEPEDKKEVSGSIPPQYLGSYQVIASGHKGYLYLWAKNNTVYGTIRFPHWGKGAVEYLKWVSIKNNQISFIRSITTRNELYRIGADSYFTQKYSGFYSQNGKLIKGHYYSDGKNMWEAKK